MLGWCNVEGLDTTFFRLLPEENLSQLNLRTEPPMSRSRCKTERVFGQKKLILLKWKHAKKKCTKYNGSARLLM